MGTERKSHKRTAKIQVYLTPREAREVADAIDRAEMPRADWCRNALLYAARYDDRVQAE